MKNTCTHTLTLKRLTLSHSHSHSHSLLQKAMTAEDERAVREVQSDVRHLVRSLVPDAEVEVFGSSMNGFGDKSSDVDITILIPEDES